MRILLSVGVSLILVAALLAKEPTAKPAPLAVGDQVPDFELKDQRGKTRSLKQLTTDGSVALVFHRSADW